MRLNSQLLLYELASARTASHHLPRALLLFCAIPLNGYLEEQCEVVAKHEKAGIVALSSLCDLVTDKVDCSETNFETYVSTESLLPSKMGRQTPSSLPQTGKVTAYRPGDILISNIRPYFKKIWYADQAGTCSGDVLVFRAKQMEHSGYLYSCMRSDAFFDYVMKSAKGTKMPRGDKKQMLTYEVAGAPSEATVAFIGSALDKVSSANRESTCLAALRDALLPKLMSGEIDFSKVDLTQLNSHLEERGAFCCNSRANPYTAATAATTVTYACVGTVKV